MQLYTGINGLKNNVKAVININNLQFENSELMEALSLQTKKELENFKNDFLYLTHRLVINSNYPNIIVNFMDYEGYIIHNHHGYLGYISNIMIEYIFGVSYFLGHKQNKSMYYVTENASDGKIENYNSHVNYIKLEDFAKFQFKENIAKPIN